MNTEAIETGISWLQTSHVFEMKSDAEKAGRIGERAAKELAELKEVLAQPSNSAEPPQVQHILTRDQRDALVAANVLLAVMQAADEAMFNRIQGIIDEISDMLYG
jgi:hypothetical protein